MSKMAAIDFAVRRQLASDGKNPPVNYKKVMGAAPSVTTGTPAALYYDYDERSIITFLVGVANQLRLDTPPLSCQWAQLDLLQCLKGDLAGMEAYIESVTT